MAYWLHIHDVEDNPYHSLRALFPEGIPIVSDEANVSAQGKPAYLVETSRLNPEQTEAIVQVTIEILRNRPDLLRKMAREHVRQGWKVIADWGAPGESNES